MRKSKETTIRVEDLGKQIARAVLIAPDVNRKTGEQYTQEVVYTARPGWSKVGKYEVALPGGKIEIAEGDFTDVIDKDSQDNPELLITLEQMIMAGLNAAEREVLEELGIPLMTGLLQFVDRSINDAGWYTYSYVGVLPEKPTVLVKPNSAGTLWINTRKILQGNPRLLNGHLGISRRAIKKVR
jgi:8-oxo-dGTP pyrophosphatase MutT (NUDIX family)